jgi:hypothetical protein
MPCIGNGGQGGTELLKPDTPTGAFGQVVEASHNGSFRFNLLLSCERYGFVWRRKSRRL